MSDSPILLIEDNPTDIELARRAFGRERLVVAEDGDEAMAYLWGRARDTIGMPALTLLDLKLPGCSGIEVLRQLRADARTQRIPVVVLSSSSEESDIAAAYDAGANSYIRKPVDYRKFVKAVEQLVAYWLHLNERPPITAGRPER